MNASKTELRTVSIGPEEASTKAGNGDPLEQVHEFKYLGSYIAQSRKVVGIRKSIARILCKNFGPPEFLRTRKSNSSMPLLTVEPVLLYAYMDLTSETCSLNRQFEKCLDGCYTSEISSLEKSNEILGESTAIFLKLHLCEGSRSSLPYCPGVSYRWTVVTDHLHF